MKIVVKIFLLLSLFLGVNSIAMKGVIVSFRYKQTAYAFHQALQVAMYHESHDVFEDVFRLLAPKDMVYNIDLVGAHEYPRLRRYRVQSNKGNLKFAFDETMIEERFDE